MAIMVESAKKGTRVNYFRAELFCLKFFGYSLTGNESKPYRIYGLLFFSSALLYVLLDAYELTKHDDINVTAEMLTYLAGFLIGLSKGSVVFRNRTQIGELINKLQEKPFLPDSERGGNQEAKILEKCLWLTKIQTSVYYLACLVALSGNIIYLTVKRITSIDYHDWKFGYGPFTVLNVTYSPNYEISSFFQNTSAIYGALVFISTDLLLATILAHITYQFKILQNYVRSLVRISYNESVENKTSSLSVSSNNTTDETDYSGVSWVILKTHVTNAVRYHLAIIGIADEVETVFSDLLLLAFLGTLGLLCCCVYSASMATNQAQLARHLIEMVNACMQLLTICYWGEQVVYESQQVGLAAYESKFVGTDLRYQKFLSFIIRRSQNPTQLTAGKFTVISLPTFAWVLRASYSAFTVLRRSNTNEI